MTPRERKLPATPLTHYLKGLRDCEPLSREEEVVLARKYRDTRDLDAAHRLIRSNLRAVVKIAVQYTHPEVGLAELVQEGNLGLLQAVERFDPERNVRLVTYASWWIRAYIQRFLQRRYKASRVTTALSNAERTTGGGGRQAPASHGAWSRMVEISLDQTPAWSTRKTMYDTIADDRPTQESEYMDREASRHHQAWLREALEDLTSQEREVIERRYLGDRAWTLKEIGEYLHLSRQRIHQIELRARRKLKSALRQYPVVLHA